MLLVFVKLFLRIVKLWGSHCNVRESPK